jgi:hypothetical protein
MTATYADQEKIDLILSKPAREITDVERAALMVNIGLPSLPYPMVRYAEDEDGNPITQMGIVDPNSAVQMAIPSIYGPERVNGELYRNMPTPQTMPLLVRMVERAQIDSKNKLVAVFGDPATGKSYMIMKFCELLHPQGALRVDCGGMNMRELFFRTVIDYGKGVKDSFESSLQLGRISQGSIDEINSEFPEAIITKDKKSSINWDLIGKPKRDQDKVQIETSQEANERARKVLEGVYKREGIEIKSNAFGIKTVPGVIIECEMSGRPLLLDEFNKGKRGTHDSYQAYMEYARGDIDELTIPNPMATSDDDPDCPREITLRRKDRKASFMLVVSGNEAKDGDTTHEMSDSMKTRLGILWISKADLNDWKHRTSQFIAGLPLHTLHGLAQGQITEQNANQFAEWLCYLRSGLGMTAAEQKAVPVYQNAALKNYKSTTAAVNMLGEFFYYMQRLANPESDLHAPGRTAKEGEVQAKIDPAVADEISAHGNKLNASFRTMLDICRDSTAGKIKSVDLGAAKFDFSLRDEFKLVKSDRKPGWATYGENMQQLIREYIFNATADMPAVRKHLIAVGKELGIFPDKLKEAKPADFYTLDQLLMFDDDTSTPDERMIRDMLANVLRARYPELRQAQTSQLISMEKVSAAVRGIAAEVPVIESAPPRTDDSKPVEPAYYKYVTVSADKHVTDGEPPVDIAYVLPSVLEVDTTSSQSVLEPMDYRSFLLGLVIPQYAVSNWEKIWPTDILKSSLVTLDDDKSNIEPMDMIAGLSKFGININIINVGDGSGNTTELLLIEDANNKRLLAAGEKPVTTEILAQLKEGGVTYVSVDDANSRDVYTAFLRQAIEKKLIMSNERSVIEEIGEVGRHMARAYMVTLGGEGEQKIAVKAQETIIELMRRVNHKTHERKIYTAAVIKHEGKAAAAPVQQPARSPGMR